jgi:hypothetical protein
MTDYEAQWFEETRDQLHVEFAVLSGFVQDAQGNLSAMKHTMMALSRNPKLSAAEISRIWDTEVERFAAWHSELMPQVYASAKEELALAKRRGRRKQRKQK